MSDFFDSIFGDEINQGNDGHSIHLSVSMKDISINKKELFHDLYQKLEELSSKMEKKCREEKIFYEKTLLFQKMMTITMEEEKEKRKKLSDHLSSKISDLNREIFLMSVKEKTLKEKLSFFLLCKDNYTGCHKFYIELSNGILDIFLREANAIRIEGNHKKGWIYIYGENRESPSLQNKHLTNPLNKKDICIASFPIVGKVGFSLATQGIEEKIRRALHTSELYTSSEREFRDAKEKYYRAKSDLMEFICL